jgi:hypothetical protein
MDIEDVEVYWSGPVHLNDHERIVAWKLSWRLMLCRRSFCALAFIKDTWLAWCLWRMASILFSTSSCR